MRWADQLTAVLLLGVAFVLGREALRLTYSDASHVPGPGFLPFWLAVGLAVGAAGMLLERRWKTLRSSAWFPSRGGMFRVSILTALTVLLVFSIGPLGMYIAVGLYLLAFLAIYMPGRWLVILLVATGSPLTIYLVFERWLKVLMPRSFLGF